LYHQEIAYRLLQSVQGQHVRLLASADLAQNWLSPVIGYARSHLAEPLTVPKMAEMANLSTSAFAHRFRNATGLPPYRFLKEMRLHHAHELLAEGRLTVSQISRQVGYASVSQFIHAFRNRYGVTPRAHAEWQSTQPASATASSAQLMPRQPEWATQRQEPAN
jgi:AraC-like DNA-binding protein